jgi:hypothetical protein
MFTFKKGQISLFVIIGVIIVVLGAYFLTSKNDITLFADQSPSFQTTQNIKEFVTSCIQTQTEKGLQVMGVKGGWLYEKNIPYLAKYDDPNQLILRSSGYEDIAGVSHPYWDYYDVRENAFVQQIPSFNDDGDDFSMQNQLERYLSETLDIECFNGFKDFEEVASIVYDPSLMEVSVDFDEEIEIQVELPIEITHIAESSTDVLTDFSFTMENPFFIPYYLARDITNAQIETSFLEKATLSFFAPFQETETRENLPPFYSSTLDYDFRPWFIPDVRLKAQQILESFLPEIQFLETRPSIPPLPDTFQDNPIAQGVHQMYAKEYFRNIVTNEDYSLVRSKGDRRSLGIFNRYQDYVVFPRYSLLTPFYFKIQQAAGNMVLLPKPDDLLPFPIRVTLTEYIASYDVTYPVTFSIIPKGEDNFYTFNFALQVNIRNNNPLREQPSYLTNLSVIKPDVSESYKKSLVCNPTQFLSKPVTVSLVDPINYGNAVLGEEYPVEGVDVEFVCRQGVATCYLGRTKIVNNATNLSIKLPLDCNPGTLKFSKFGSKTVTIPTIDVGKDYGQDLGKVEIPSGKTLKFKFGKLGYDLSYTPNTQSRLKKEERGIVIFESLEDENLVEFVDVTYDNQDDLSITLVPGLYSVQAFVLVNDEDHKIRAERRGGTDLPEINLTAWMRAQYDLPEFEVTKEDLLSADTLLLVANDYGYPSTYSALEESENTQDVKIHSARRPPKFCIKEQVDNRLC